MLQIKLPFGVVLIAFFAFPSFVLAQHTQQSPACTSELSGVVESSDGEKLPGATILFDGQHQSTTKEDGTFLVTACAGSYEIQVSYVGYETVRLTVRVPAEKRIIVRLKPSTSVLHDLIIEGLHQRQHNVSQSVDILSEEDLRLHRGKTLGDMTQQLSGVSSMNSGPGVFKPVIQGLHSQRILILNNNVRQEGQQWGVEHAPEIDTYIASEIEVVKGAETVRYGSDALGGVIIVTTPSLHYTPGLGGEISLHSATNNRLGAFSGSLEGGLRKGQGVGWRIQGSLKKGGDYHAPDYNLSNTGMEEANVSATMGLKTKNKSVEFYLSSFNTTLGILRSAHTGNLNDLESSIRDERPWYIRKFTYNISKPRQEIGHHLAKLKSEMNIGFGTATFQYAIQLNRRKEFDIRRSSQNDRPGLSLTQSTQTLDMALDHRIGKWSGSIGISGTYKDNDNELSTGILPDFQQGNIALFLIERRDFRRWKVELGGRIEYQYLNVFAFDQQSQLIKPVYHFNYGATSIGAAYRFSESFRLTNHVSYSVRPPHTSELFSVGLHHSAGVIEEGLLVNGGSVSTNPDRIANEASSKWISSFQWSSKKVTMELSMHANYFRDFVYLRPYDTRLTIRGYFPVFRYDQHDVLFAGGEFLSHMELTKRINYKFSAAYLYTENASTGERMPMIPPARVEHRISYTKKSVKNWNNVFVRLDVETIFKQNRNPSTRYPSEVISSDKAGSFDFMDAPPAYTLVSVSVGGEFPSDNRKVSVALSCDNLFNTSYRSLMNRLRYFTDEPGRNISLQVSYQFHSHKQ